MNLEEKIARALEEKMAEARAYRIATQAAEEFIRCEGMKTDCPDEFVFHGADLADEHFQDCIAHLKWVGECVTHELDDESIAVMLGDFTLESLA